MPGNWTFNKMGVKVIVFNNFRKKGISLYKSIICDNIMNDPDHISTILGWNNLHKFLIYINIYLGRLKFYHR